MTTQQHADPKIPSLPGASQRPPVEAQRPERASAVRVVLLGLALLVLLGAFGYLLMPRGGEVPFEPLEDELFEEVTGPLPFGLQAEVARQLPSKERMLSYAADGGASVDPGTANPTELTLVEYPAARAERVLSDQFKKLRFESAEGRGGGGRGRPGGGGGRGGPPGRGGSEPPKEKPPELQDAGYMDWHGYRANYARLRHSLPGPTGEAADAASVDPGGLEGGTADDGRDGSGGEVDEGEKKPGPFYETIRVNLSTGGRCLIAYLRFPDNSVGSTEPAERVLASFRPPPER